MPLQSVSQNANLSGQGVYSRCTASVQKSDGRFWGKTPMSNRIEAAQYLYRTRFPGEDLTPFRAFEDGTYVLIQFMHGDGDGTSTPMGTEIVEFKSDGSISSFRRGQSKLHHSDMYGTPIEPGPVKPFDLDKTDSNKELMRQYFAATTYSEGDFLKLYSRLALSDGEWFKKTGPRDAALVDSMRAYAASFLHDDLVINSTFPTDILHLKEQMMDNVHHVLVKDFDLLIGCGNFVYLQYHAEGRDISSTETLFVSIEDDQIKFIL